MITGMWVIYSIIMFLSSVALYLTVRKSSLLKVQTELTNLAMFAIPLVLYIIYNLFVGQSMAVSFNQILLVLFIGIVFAYGGNTASLKAINVAPNPGYSLVLSKSYVLFTTIVAVLFLGAELSLQKTIAIFMIVGFSALIMINRKSAKKVKPMQWVMLSFGAFFAWGFLSLFSKYLFNNGMGTMPFLIYLYLVVTICILWSVRKKMHIVKLVTKNQWILLVLTGVFSALFNLGQFQAIKFAPNVGYVNAINAGSISLVTIMAVILFKDELSLQKAIGVLGVTAGLILLLV